MNIGIIGPNKLPYFEKEENRKQKLIRLVEILKNFNLKLVLTPDKNSLLEFFGKECLKRNIKIIEIVPLNSSDYKKYLNVDLGEIISCDDWRKQPSIFSENCDFFICIGYSAGTLSEIGASKYFNPKKIIILKDFILEKLPKEINKEFDIEYIKLDLLNKKITKYLQQN